MCDALFLEKFFTLEGEEAWFFLFSHPTPPGGGGGFKGNRELAIGSSFRKKD